MRLRMPEKRSAVCCPGSALRLVNWNWTFDTRTTVIQLHELKSILGENWMQGSCSLMVIEVDQWLEDCQFNPPGRKIWECDEGAHWYFKARCVHILRPQQTRSFWLSFVRIVFIYSCSSSSFLRLKMAASLLLLDVTDWQMGSSVTGVHSWVQNIIKTKITSWKLWRRLPKIVWAHIQPRVTDRMVKMVLSLARGTHTRVFAL